MFLRLPEGKFGTDSIGEGLPIFMAYFKSTHFTAGHYQAVSPVSNEPVVREILQTTGQDMSKSLRLDNNFSFGPTSTSTVMQQSAVSCMPTSKRKRSPSPPMLSPLPSVSLATIASPTLAALQQLIPQNMGISWIEVQQSS